MYYFIVAKVVPEKILIIETDDDDYWVTTKEVLEYSQWSPVINWDFTRNIDFELLIDDFNSKFKTSYIKSKSTWHNWGTPGAGNLKPTTMVNGRLAIIDVKWVKITSAPMMITMPNGQEGYICLGRCRGFFSYVEANRPNGYICMDCRG